MHFVEPESIWLCRVFTLCSPKWSLSARAGVVAHINCLQLLLRTSRRSEPPLPEQTLRTYCEKFVSRDFLLTFCHRVEEQILQTGKDSRLSPPALESRGDSGQRNETREMQLFLMWSEESLKKCGDNAPWHGPLRSHLLCQSKHEAYLNSSCALITLVTRISPTATDDQSLQILKGFRVQTWKHYWTFQAKKPHRFTAARQ